MGTWGTGPFHNDEAAEFAEDLDDLTEMARPLAIRYALTEAAGVAGYLDADVAAIAVAAAALVGAQCQGRGRIDPVHGPKRPIPQLPSELRAVAVRALARVLATDSELSDLWATSADSASWRDQVTQLHHTLTL
ncbi:MAG TPA: DUF4259 domain-containing protein [Pseudonocardiaceae bacterium]|jgi:hypothetical protein|nr:DUF4259 domain-containing protein [Pseudonocardiaceae bacterium]